VTTTGKGDARRDIRQFLWGPILVRVFLGTDQEWSTAGANQLGKKTTSGQKEPYKRNPPGLHRSTLVIRKTPGGSDRKRGKGEKGKHIRGPKGKNWRKYGTKHGTEGVSYFPLVRKNRE